MGLFMLDTHLVSFGASRPLLSWVTLGREDREFKPQERHPILMDSIKFSVHDINNEKTKSQTYRRAISSGHSWQTWFSCGTLLEKTRWPRVSLVPNNVQLPSEHMNEL